jgi:hypothetical protein
MGNNKHRNIKVLNIFLEPDECNQIQMICWLIKHKNFWLGENDLGDGDSHSPSSREFLGRYLKLVLLEPETCQNVDSLCFSVVGIDSIQALIDLSETVSHLNLFLWLHLTGVNVRDICLLFEELESLHITIKNVLENWDIITSHFLFNLEDMEVHRHLVKLTSAHCVNEGGFTDTVSTYQTILTSSCETYCSFIEESLTSCHKSDVRQIDISF